MKILGANEAPLNTDMWNTTWVSRRLCARIHPDEVGGGKKKPSDLFPTLKRISICKKAVGNGTGEHMAKWPNV